MAGTSLQVAVQPPSRARLGATLYPPLVVAMRSNAISNGSGNDLSRVWAFATLIDDYGDVVNDQLTGTLAESAQTFSGGSGLIGYFLFDNLHIEDVGRFRIRVTLMRMDSGSSGAASVQQIESRIIVVEDRDVARQSASIATRYGPIENVINVAQVALSDDF